MNAEINRQLRVLVVDDKAFVRTMTGRVLQTAGVENVAYAADGKEAIDYIKRANPRVGLVFCDLMMPDMDGVEVVRHVAELDHKPAFVFISGANAALLSTAADMARARGLLVLGAIEKPISIEAVRAMLAKLDGVRPARTAPQSLSLTPGDALAASRSRACSSRAIRGLGRRERTDQAAYGPCAVARPQAVRAME
jgi:CheY-like chemotaxis protein